MDFEQLMENEELVRNLVASAALVLTALALRFAALRMVRATGRTDKLRLSWMAWIKRVTLVLILGGLVTIWATELRTAALSLVAVAVALVIASKELILCILGSVLRMSSGSFSLGDRIEIGTLRGDVIDHTLLSTTILEIGPGHQRTGRAVVIPNALLLSEPVINETFTEDYVLHVIRVPLRLEDDIAAAEKLLLRAARTQVQPYIDDARKHMERLAIEHGLPTATTQPDQKSPVEPRVIAAIPDEGRVDLLLRVPTPARGKGKTEQEILRRFVDGYRQLRTGGAA